MMHAPPLAHRATVLRNTQGGTDPGGGTLPPVMGIHDPAMPCQFWVIQERPTEGPNVSVVIEDARMIVGKGADVTVGDQVRDVRDRIGRPLIEPGAILRVLSDIIQPPTHRSLALELISGSYTPPAVP